MPFVTDYLIHSTIIEGQGVPKEDARRLGLLPALLNLPMAQSLLVSTLIGQNNAPARTSIVPAPPPLPPPQVFVPVPGVVGKTFEDASQILEKSGLLANRLSIQQPGEVVLVQKPEADEPAPVGSSVDLFVGQPEAVPLRLVKLDGLINQPVDRVRKQLEDEGLVVVEILVDVTNNVYKPGVVVDHEPGAGTLVRSGTTITLFVQVDKPVTSRAPGRSATAKSEKSNQPVESDPKPS